LAYILDGPNTSADGVLLNAPNSLYAFIEGGVVKYIGKTTRSIRKRFIGYQKPGKSQRRNWRNNRNIRDALAADAEVRIFVFNPVSRLQYGDFEINLAAGLEDSLIEAFDPPWNGRDRGRAITEEAEREELEGDETQAKAATPESAEPLPAMAHIAPPPSATSFKIILGEAYYNQGYINPGVEASASLGADGDLIEVSFDDGCEPVLSHIDRRANRNGSVRIVGRNRLIARWFQAHFDKGDMVGAVVLDANRILLLSKALP
jgi:hypothetical protein